MDPKELPALIVSITGLITAIGTLIMVLKSHANIQTIQTQPHSTLTTAISALAQANSRRIGYSRVGDPTATTNGAPSAGPTGAG